MVKQTTARARQKRLISSSLQSDSPNEKPFPKIKKTFLVRFFSSSFSCSPVRVASKFFHCSTRRKKHRSSSQSFETNRKSRSQGRAKMGWRKQKRPLRARKGLIIGPKTNHIAVSHKLWTRLHARRPDIWKRSATSAQYSEIDDQRDLDPTALSLRIPYHRTSLFLRVKVFCLS